ncbi:MAG: hypothetical protein KDK91_04965 [Gammaproteobacteria bacterium]|nr:hypothetical protein [Gammaproteobacteria bacterium]
MSRAAGSAALHSAVLVGFLAWVLCLGGCGGRQSPSTDAAFDNGAERARRAGLQAFADGRYELAARSFQQMLDAAYQSDDSSAIVDARYNLAASLAELGRQASAIDLLDAAETELRREGRDVSADITLLRATIEYRAGRFESVLSAIAPLLARPQVEPRHRARAHYLRGLVGARSGDRAAVRESLRGIVQDDPRNLAGADRDELEGRLAALDGEPLRGVRLIERAAARRSRDGDYHSAARALADAGEIALTAQHPRLAAEYLLRAGRSAALTPGGAHAQRWLIRARQLALEVGDRATAVEAQGLLDGPARADPLDAQPQASAVEPKPTAQRDEAGG